MGRPPNIHCSLESITIILLLLPDKKSKYSHLHITHTHIQVGTINI